VFFPCQTEGGGGSQEVWGNREGAGSGRGRGAVMSFTDRPGGHGKLKSLGEQGQMRGDGIGPLGVSRRGNGVFV